MYVAIVNFFQDQCFYQYQHYNYNNYLNKMFWLMASKKSIFVNRVGGDSRIEPIIYLYFH